MRCSGQSRASNPVASLRSSKLTCVVSQVVSCRAFLFAQAPGTYWYLRALEDQKEEALTRSKFEMRSQFQKVMT